MLAGCGSVHASSSGPAAATTPVAAPPTSTAPAVPSITCSDISTDLAKVVRDLKTEDKVYQGAWVSGPDGSDLQALISDTQNANTGGISSALMPPRSTPTPRRT